MKKLSHCLVLVVGFSAAQAAFGFKDCAGNIRFDNKMPGQGRIVEDFMVSARDAGFSMSFVTAVKTIMRGPVLEAVRYEDCQPTSWPDDSGRVETICRIPASIGFAHFPRYIGVVREGSRTVSGYAEVYFLDQPSISGQPIGTIFCEAF